MLKKLFLVDSGISIHTQFLLKHMTYFFILFDREIDLFLHVCIHWLLLILMLVSIVSCICIIMCLYAMIVICINYMHLFG